MRKQAQNENGGGKCWRFGIAVGRWRSRQELRSATSVGRSVCNSSYCISSGAEEGRRSKERRAEAARFRSSLAFLHSGPSLVEGARLVNEARSPPPSRHGLGAWMRPSSTRGANATTPTVVGGPRIPVRDFISSRRLAPAGQLRPADVKSLNRHQAALFSADSTPS